MRGCRATVLEYEHVRATVTGLVCLQAIINLAFANLKLVLIVETGIARARACGVQSATAFIIARFAPREISRAKREGAERVRAEVRCRGALPVLAVKEWRRVHALVRAEALRRTLNTGGIIANTHILPHTSLWQDIC